MDELRRRWKAAVGEPSAGDRFARAPKQKDAASLLPGRAGAGERPHLTTCVGCRTNAPDTDTTYTLMSAAFGWRLSKREGYGVEWRCPACWKKFKADAAARGEVFAKATAARRTS
jgi:hypothetical protein